MKFSDYLSIFAVIVALGSFIWQIIKDSRRDKPKLKIRFKPAFFMDMDDAGNIKEYIPYIDVWVTNLGYRTIYIDRPYICLPEGFKYHKMLNKETIKKYPIQLEPLEKTRIGITGLTIGEDGNINMDNGDSVIFQNKVLVFTSPSKITPGFGQVKQKKSIFKNSTPRDLVTIEIMDSNEKIYKTKKFSVSKLQKDHQSLKDMAAKKK
jgi:hypothetical protein